MSAIPQELRDLDQWVVWKLEERDGEPTKVPYRAADPTVKASSTDPATWSSYETAVDAWKARDHDLAGPQRLDGLGFILSAADPYAGVDLDDCLDGTTMHPAAEAIVDLLGSFTEISPSGTGVKIIVRASKNGNGRCRTKKTPWGGEIEVYDTGRFWTITERPWGGTQGAIEEAQTQLGTLLAHFLPAEVATAASARPTQPVALDDRELLERMFAAKNGDKIKRLWNGDLSDYADDHSGADLGLCDALAFWTGCDPARMESMFSDSALGQRDKWTQRADYRLRTIEKAIEGCSEVYEPAARQGASDEPTHLTTHLKTASPLPVEGASVAGASGASLRSNDVPATDALTQPPSGLAFEVAAEFANEDEEGAEMLLGYGPDDAAAVAGGTIVFFGAGGAGKTTLTLDGVLRLTTETPWLGLQVPRALRFVIVENDGPRGRFRRKIRAKLASWAGDPPGDRLIVLTKPWGEFSLARGDHRQALAAHIRENNVDVLLAGPIVSLGMIGGGTPDEVSAFEAHLVALRALVGRPLAVWLIHHQNVRGQISGAWDRVPDTLIRVVATGNGRTRLVWEKARDSSTLHGTSWKLKWAEGQSFEIDDTPDLTEEEIAEEIVAAVLAKPGASWNDVDKATKGTAKKKREIRDRLIAQGELVNRGKGNSFALFVTDDADLSADQITFADLQEVTLEKQRETGQYGHPLSEMTAEAQRRKRERPE